METKHIIKYKNERDSNPVPPGSGFCGEIIKIDFIVKTYPPTYEAKVYMKFTCNKWKTWEKTKFRYSHTKKQYDYWYGSFYTYADYNGDLPFTDDILTINYCFQVKFPNDKIYWDNNDNNNYTETIKTNYNISLYGERDVDKICYKSNTTQKI